MKYLYTLVDYDNAVQIKERTESDIENNLAALTKSICETVYAKIPGSEEADCRLYGGWRTVDNQYTRRAEQMLGRLQRFRGRRGRIRVKLSMITEVLARDGVTIAGTYQNGAQKMVDVMLALDLLYLSKFEECGLVLVSDDSDLLPAILVAASRRGRVNQLLILSRSDREGYSRFQEILTSHGIRMAKY